ncbi:murein L,D-transpeptidase [Periweissella cryptocerci]|uniref:Murein L,D-transpeptidase n=1 Tax=Periweissella cryptocerci TaxID=2506420 RepID=A0A4P6YU30_9LACO|nr:L,D-transpeptidase [Periweissella cryptocerci]QBO36216.1 murein L,D-transpeptidase [Periweissella cryptocerci]
MKKGLFITLGVLVVAALVGGGYGFYQNSLIKKDTTVVLNQHTVKLDRLTNQQALVKLKKVDQSYVVKLEDKEENTSHVLRFKNNQKITLKDVEKLQQGKTNYNPAIGDLSEKQVVTVLKADLPVQVKRTPKNAKLILKQDHYEVLASRSGSKIHYNRMAKNIVTQAKKHTGGYLVLPIDYQQPKLTSERAQAQAEKLNKTLKTDIKLQVGSKEVVVPMSVKAQAVRINTIKTAPIVKWLDAKVDPTVGTLNKPIKFKTHKGKMMKLANTTAASGIGTYVKSKDTANKIATALTAGEDTTVKAPMGGKKYKKNFGGTYIELDLTNAHAYMYKKGKKVIDWPFISGKKATGHATVTGVFRILYKEQTTPTHEIHLRGNNSDGSKYDSVVNYWLPFESQGYGIHDAPWQANYNFGVPSANAAVGSHGCINTQPSVMPTVYKLATTNMPVVSYGALGK